MTVKPDPLSGRELAAFVAAVDAHTLYAAADALALDAVGRDEADRGQDPLLSVDEIICTYNPTRHETSPVAVVTTITAELVCAFLSRIMPRTKETSPTTSVKMVSMFSTGCDCPSEFRTVAPASSPP